MTIKEIFDLRQKGLIEEAYQAIRQLYATDKGPYASTAMFWIALDIFRKRLREGKHVESRKILLAIERMLPNVPDKDGRVRNAYQNNLTMMTHYENQEHTKKNAHIRTGKWGEQIAVTYLREKGYVILERDWHSGHRDIDIIAKNGTCIVFVEVKTRRDRNYTDPVTAVNYQKQHNLQLAINHYLKSHRLDNPIRFDVISIVGTPESPNPDIEHIEDFRLCSF